MVKSKAVKTHQLYPWCLTFKHTDGPPFGHPQNSFLTSHYSIGIHASYGQCTSVSDDYEQEPEHQHIKSHISYSQQQQGEEEEPEVPRLP